MGPKWQSVIEFSLFTLRWWEKVLVLCFSQITFWLISFSRFDAVFGLVRSRQRFASLSHQSFLGRLPRRTE
jgi:hypothetical protein